MAKHVFHCLICYQSCAITSEVIKIDKIDITFQFNFLEWINALFFIIIFIMLNLNTFGAQLSHLYFMTIFIINKQTHIHTGELQLINNNIMNNKNLLLH